MTDAWNTHRSTRVVRWAVFALGIAGLLPASSPAQARPDSGALTRASVRDSALVTLTPSRPKQGSVLRITIRPPAPSRTITDSTALGRPRADTAAGSVAWTIARPGSARTDSLALPLPDSVRPSRGMVPPDSVTSRTIAADSVGGEAVRIRGTLFGEPLHFVPADSGAYVAIGGIPVDAPASARVAVIVERFGVPADTVQVRLDIARTAYKMEKLTVAPKFGQAPDSALAARMAREAALAADVSRRSHDAPALWTGEFSRPRASRVTSAFGDGREFNGKVQSRHMGLDLAGVVGAPVVAAGRGVVALVGDFYLAGNAVYIDHGGGLVTAYFHLSAVNVAKGDTVAAGDTIGKVGATGRVTGPHLHWVARYGAVTIDPSTLLELPPFGASPDRSLLQEQRFLMR